MRWFVLIFQLLSITLSFYLTCCFAHYIIYLAKDKHVEARESVTLMNILLVFFLIFWALSKISAFN